MPIESFSVAAGLRVLDPNEIALGHLIDRFHFDSSGGSVQGYTSDGALLLNQPVIGHLDQQNNGSLVGGTAEIGGELVVSLLDGFSPEVGDRFWILRASNRNGAFLGMVIVGGRRRCRKGNLSGRRI